MLTILIVEDDALLAETLKHLIELNPRYEVTGLASDLETALAAVEERRPDLALVDLQLARGSTGFSVAVKLNERDIPCLFATGNAPSFPIAELALGCLSKPYFEEDVVRALKAAEDILRGRERLRPSLPDALQIYPAYREDAAGAEIPPEMPAFVASRTRPKRGLFKWWGG